MNVKKIREDFPLLLANPDLTYLDSAATSQKPACVLRAEREFYECHNANPLRGLYELSENATKCYEDARKTVQHFIGAARPEEIIFTRNATESLNLVAYSLGSLLLKPGDEVVVSIAVERTQPGQRTRFFSLTIRGHHEPDGITLHL